MRGARALRSLPLRPSLLFLPNYPLPPSPLPPPISLAGEDALVNVSVEEKSDGGIRGHIRIRAKTQGVALSLGDRISAKQRGDSKAGGK